MKHLVVTSLVLLSAAAIAPPENPLERLPADRAGDIVRRSIEYAGGWEAWASIRTIEFQKTTLRYRPDGTEETRRVQHHRYVLRPLRARIEWEEGGKKIVLINNGRQAWKLVDGAVAGSTEDRNQARNATFGSHYVFNMPFKLTDSGAHLT
jgi:hypothetical protein